MDEKSVSRELPFGTAFTRRTIVRGGAIVLSGATMITPVLGALDRPLGIVSAQAIHQEETFAAAPSRFYEALLDSKEFTALSGGQLAIIDRDAGGTFSLFAGVITGRNIENVTNKRIVQAWRNNLAWPAGLYSIVRFELRPQGPGTLVILDHTGFPNAGSEAEHLASGWSEHYWRPLRKYLA